MLLSMYNVENAKTNKMCLIETEKWAKIKRGKNNGLAFMATKSIHLQYSHISTHKNRRTVYRAEADVL